MKYAIQLNETERFLVALTKNHFKNKLTGKSWVEVMQESFRKIYGYEFENNFNDNFTIFAKLYKIYYKISQNSLEDTLLIFAQVFNERSFRKDEKTIERAIGEVCGLIQATTVRGRFSLKIKTQTKPLYL